MNGAAALEGAREERPTDGRTEGRSDVQQKNAPKGRGGSVGGGSGVQAAEGSVWQAVGEGGLPRPEAPGRGRTRGPRRSQEPSEVPRPPTASCGLHPHILTSAFVP